MITIRTWMIYAAMLVFLVLTAPDQKAHENKIQDLLSNNATDGNVVQVSLGEVAGISYHDIHLFTYTLQNRRVLTFGLLGFVLKVG